MEFESAFSIGEEVNFLHPDIQQYSIVDGVPQDLCIGTVVSVRFTKMKVFYDVFSPYKSEVLYNIHSDNIYGIQKPAHLEECPA
jgi:hypothetical protein